MMENRPSIYSKINFKNYAKNRQKYLTFTLAIWVIPIKKLCKPTFKKKDHGQGAGIPVLKTIWDLFDLSILFSQTGIRKHSGVPTWLLAFAYICGLVHNSSSTNQNAKYSADAPFLQQLLSGQLISQSEDGT
ncbi:MAG: hypothetical protein ACYC2T_15095 [Bacillota bacterium]